MVQSSNLVCFESDEGAIKGMWFASVCLLFVSKRIERKLYLYKTPMYFSYFVYFAHFMLYYDVWDQFALAFQFW